MIHEKKNLSPPILNSALKMSIGTFISRILGFMRDVFLAQYFSRNITDSFVIAFRIPNLFRRLFGEGSISSGFIPVFLDYLGKKDKAIELVNSVWTFFLLFTALITSVVILFMDQIILWILSGDSFKNFPEKIERTIYLARIIFTYFFFVTQFAFFMSVLNALKSFFIPGVAPAIFNFIMILSILIPPQSFQSNGLSLALGVFIGSVLQMGVVGLALWRKSFFPSFDIKYWKKKGVFRVLEKVFPSFLGLLFLQTIPFVNIYFASFLEEGSHSSIYWGDRILELPQSLIAISLGTALLPSLSRLWNSGEKEKMIDHLTENIKILLFLSLPSALGVYLLASPIIETFFMRGEFDSSDLKRTVKIVHFYSVLLIFSSLSKILTSAFYSVKKPWFPAFVSFISLCVHIFFGFYLTRSFGLRGLVGSTTLSGFIHMILLFSCFHFFINPLKIKSLFKTVLSILTPLFFMGFMLFFISPFFNSFGREFQGGKFMFLFLIVILSALFYFGLSLQLKIPQMKFILSSFKKSFKNRN